MSRIKKNNRKTPGKKTKSPSSIRRQLIKGTLIVNARKGFGFVSPEKASLIACDIFIPATHLKGAVDGDLVEVAVSGAENTNKTSRLKGVVIRVLQSSKTQIVGTITELLSPLLASCYIPFINLHKNYNVNLMEGRTYLPGDLILIHAPAWTEKPPKKRSFIMKEFIGNIADPKYDFNVVKEEFNLQEHFPREVDAEAEQCSMLYSEPETRLDLRKLLCFTIDSASAKDFDDAVSLETNPNGHYILGVHIADVSHYVRPGTALDQEASSRGNSTYFPDKVIPMLPHSLSDDLCSLKPGRERFTVSVFMTLDSQGKLLEYRFSKSVIKSKYRLTYDEVDDVIEKKISHPLEKSLLEMFALSQKLQLLRENRGCIRFTLPSFSLKLNKKKEVVGLIPNRQTDSHRLIEEFMLKANETVATHLQAQGTVIPFRIHEEPEASGLENFHQLITSLGFQLTLTHTQEFDYQMLLHKVATHPLGPFIHSHFVRSMKTASYSTENKGHYGLKLTNYTHFTSPIRRYSDLIVHRLLFDPQSANEEMLEEIVKNCSSKERTSAKAEFAFSKIKKLRFLQQRFLENREFIYEALIINLKSEGLTFIVPDLFHEDMIPMAALPFSLRKLATTAKDSPQKTALIGQNIGILIKDIDLIKQTIHWVIQPTSDDESEPSESESPSKYRRKPYKRSRRKPKKKPAL